MMADKNYSTATKKRKWGKKERGSWLKLQTVKRSYFTNIVATLKALSDRFAIVQYGLLSYAAEKYPLYLLKTSPWDEHKKSVLITGGVHGYETSGVLGALRFAENDVGNYADYFNFVIAPCVSPWGYETINRWNPEAIDPNRSFYANSPANEASLLMKMLKSLKLNLTAHFDLHETTDSDNSEFMPALAARDAKELVIWEIPDGFYVVGDKANPQTEFQRAIITAVEAVTHIAPPDKTGCIIGEPVTDKGVIYYENRKLGLCSGFNRSRFCTTTEVYPDSPRVNNEDCIKAQVTAIKGGLNFIIETELLSGSEKVG